MGALVVSKGCHSLGSGTSFLISHAPTMTLVWPGLMGCPRVVSVSLTQLPWLRGASLGLTPWPLAPSEGLGAPDLTVLASQVSKGLTMVGGLCLTMMLPGSDLISFRITPRGRPPNAAPTGAPAAAPAATPAATLPAPDTPGAPDAGLVTTLAGAPVPMTSPLESLESSVPVAPPEGVVGRPPGGGALTWASLAEVVGVAWGV